MKAATVSINENRGEASQIVIICEAFAFSEAIYPLQTAPAPEYIFCFLFAPPLFLQLYSTSAQSQDPDSRFYTLA